MGGQNRVEVGYCVVLVHRGRSLLGEAYALEAAKVQNLSSSCIFTRQNAGDLLYKHKLPFVERGDELFPQSESANPNEPSSTPAPAARRLKTRESVEVLHRMLQMLQGSPVVWSCGFSAEAQNRANVDTEKDVSNLIHDAANCSLTTTELNRPRVKYYPDGCTLPSVRERHPRPYHVGASISALR